MGNKNLQLNQNITNTSLHLEKQTSRTASSFHVCSQQYAKDPHQSRPFENKIKLSQQTRYKLKAFVAQSNNHQSQKQEKIDKSLNYFSKPQTIRSRDQELISQTSTKTQTLLHKSYDVYPEMRIQSGQSHETEGAKFRKLSSGEKLSITQQEEIGMNILQHLIAKQKYSIAPNALENQPKLGPVDRARFIDWSIKVLSGIQAQDRVLFRAVALSDRVMKFWKTPLEFKGYQLLALTCIQMAAKLQEHNLMNMEDARVYLGKQRFSKKDIIYTELQVLKLLRFRTITPTVYDFTMPMMCFVFQFLKEMQSELNKEEKIYAQKMGIFLSMLVLHEPDLMFNIVPSQISAAIVYLTLNFMKKVKSTYLNQRKLDKIQGCLQCLIQCKAETIMKLSLQIQKLYYQFEEKYPVAHTLIHNLCPNFSQKNMYSGQRDGDIGEETLKN